MNQETLHDPLAPFLEAQGVVILDGGLATELEARGCDLADDLWSAGVLLDRPELVADVHRAFLEAGADCIATASYQATLEGLSERGLDEAQSVAVLQRSVELASRARDEFWAVEANREGRLRPLVAASIGPYGAYLADGSEYRGDYGLGVDDLIAFHRHRWQILAAAGADLLACESIPDRREALALCDLLGASSDAVAWISFTCRDEAHLSDGSALDETIASIESTPGLLAIGINCTSPRHLNSLLALARTATSKPLVAYPNSGEGWDAEARGWTPSREPAASLAGGARGWLDRGARLIGGCCRSTPADIRDIRRTLLGARR